MLPHVFLAGIPLLCRLIPVLCLHGPKVGLTLLLFILSTENKTKLLDSTLLFLILNLSWYFNYLMKPDDDINTLMGGKYRQCVVVIGTALTSGLSDKNTFTTDRKDMWETTNSH